MKQQVAKLIYVWLVRIFSLLYKRLAIRNRLTYLMSFTNNENGLLKTFMEQNSDIEIVIFYTKNCKKEAEKFQSLGATIFLFDQSPVLIKKVISEMIQSRVILCDNYFPILAGFSPHKETSIIQLWHANGAIKCFGLEDPSTMSRSFFDRLRFKQVYKRFDEYIVGSKMMGEVFQRSYLATEDKILYLGFPRSDVFFDKNYLNSKKEKIYGKFPELTNKKIILYAPTYRENNSDFFALDIKRMHEELGNSYALLIKKHPHDVHLYKSEEFSGFVYDDITEFKMEEILAITDCLVTDYSSIPFEYSLLENAKKIIFYCYDKKYYSETTGLQKDFSNWAPGDIVYTIDELLESINKKNNTNFAKFNEQWNTYNDGNAKLRVIQHIKNKFNEF
ncbi:CDP-glycerol glycerophosphotransferase family protein [Carnobacterium sp. FSL W8-0810]|uniref:CDP-glycerol glycerophosphotransferase family protein n=1 Tax=Carnobacterium sp. FSL W8-0810 TaxID=2954705 RepID=UPI0030F5EBB5